ncbi:MAG: hypothetical protein VW907_04880 [Opitutae bacterium]
MFLTAEDTLSASKREFTPHPKGVCKGVCVEVVTINKKTGQPFSKTTKEGEVKNQMILVFQTDKTVEVEDGKTENCVHWEWFNIPQTIANENGKLHQFFKNWEVPIKSYETQDAFEAEVVGKPAHLVFTHNKSADGTKTYSNLTSCTAVDNPAEAFVATDYRPYAEKAGF